MKIGPGYVLCITLPRASSTAWEVKFSEGMRFMKCFWRFFSYCESIVSQGLHVGWMNLVGVLFQ